MKFLFLIYISCVIGSIPIRNDALLFCLKPEVNHLNIENSKPLRVKLGIDPTGTDIHLGHSFKSSHHGRASNLQAFEKLHSRF